MNKNKNVLLVDDEPKILEVLAALFESKGFRVFQAETGGQALKTFNERNVSLVVLDLMLPDVTGEEVCAAIRRISRVPIIMLTAKSEEEDLIAGFAGGADDYVTKPFSLKELYARAEALLRRSGDDLVPLTVRNAFGGGDLIVDFEKSAFRKAGNPIGLTPSETRILSALIKYPGKVFTRDELIDIALGDEFDGYDRVIDSHIKNLRQKIEDNPKSPVYVLTVHGLGYKFGGGGD
ncbi:MAG: response regulator transcription factor [Clostridiales Family XIII bacterium]|jgi:DNA-binding response OmpR family regulator|nr:response regulator transcription factor [Clostridiales Family XIII bacterium]